MEVTGTDEAQSHVTAEHFVQRKDDTCIAWWGGDSRSCSALHQSKCIWKYHSARHANWTGLDWYIYIHNLWDTVVQTSWHRLAYLLVLNVYRFDLYCNAHQYLLCNTMPMQYTDNYDTFLGASYVEAYDLECVSVGYSKPGNSLL